MKRLFLIILVLSLLPCTGCNMTLMGQNRDEIPYETFDTRPQPEDPTKMIQYKKAMDALAGLRYQEALQLFTELGDFKDATEYAARFAYIEDTLLRTLQYTNGVLTKTVECKYAEAGVLLDDGTEDGSLLSRIVSENGNLQIETWQYHDYILTTHYDAYNHVGTVTREERRPIFHNANSNEVKEGYNISYFYNADGLLSKDQGEIQQHSRSDNTTHISKLLFHGVYTYDTEGKLLRYQRDYTWGGMGTEWTVYTYDEHDRLIREESSKEGSIFFLENAKAEDNYGSEQVVKEYRYDEDGNRTFFSQLTTTHVPNDPPETYYIQTEYAYENGRLVQETTTFGDSSDTVIETCYVYGDYLDYIIEWEES